MTTLRFGPPPPRTFEAPPTAGEIAFFQENGFLAVERLTTDEEIAWLRQIFEFLFDPANAGRPGAPVDRSGGHIAADGARLGQAFFPELQFPEVLDSTFCRNAVLCRRPARPDPARQSSWGHMIRKPPGGQAVAWHQDRAYWQPELDYCALGVWLPLHDVSIEMGAMQFIPRSQSEDCCATGTWRIPSTTSWWSMNRSTSRPPSRVRQRGKMLAPP